MKLAIINGDDNPNTIDGTPDPDTIHGNGERDIIHGAGGGDTIFGDAGDDALFGDEGDDYLYGGVDSDFIDGGAGVDQMFGGTGNDRYVVDTAGDMVTEAAGEGFDTVRSSLEGYQLTDNVEQLILLGSTVSGKGNFLANRIFGNDANNVLRGEGGNDLLYGGNGDDIYQVYDSHETAIESSASGGFDVVYSAGSYVLGANVEALVLTADSPDSATGNELDNTLKGNRWDNLIDGGAGADIMKGGDGNDTYIVDDPGDRIFEAFDAGRDIVITPFSYSLAGTYLEDIVLTGTAANATGNSDFNTLIGNDSDNILDGREGVDNMVGGLGDDSYYVDHVGDYIEERIDEGHDTVFSSIDWSLVRPGYDPAILYFEDLVLIGLDPIDGSGNAVDNRITGNAAANVLRGQSGNDILDGGAGIDMLYGGNGDDIYYIDDVGDKAREGSGAGTGTDHVFASVSYDLAGEFIETLTLTGDNALDAYGNSLDNLITGNAGANFIDGRGGADRMIGGNGNDTYVLDNAGDRVVETSTGGIDTIRTAMSYSLGGQYVEKLVLTGSAAAFATGNGLANTLTGNGAANALSGEGGDDSLFGKGGNDSLSGGTGADRFYFDTALSASGNVDHINGYSVADDTIMLDRSIFTQIGIDGTLAASAFVNGTTAADADDRILYDSATGRIFYDSDGNGGGAAILFAEVTPGTALTHLDFQAYTGPV